MATSDLTSLLEEYVRAQPSRALGGVRALSGFEYQLRVYLADFAKALSDGDQLQLDGTKFANVLEALSDHTLRKDHLTVCVQVKRTLSRQTLADAGAEFAYVDAFLETRLGAEEYAQIRYECVARGGDATLDWETVILPSKVTSKSPDLQQRFDGLRSQNRLVKPRIEPDPWWRLIAAIYRQVDDPFAFAREALDLSLSRGLDADGARRVRDAIAENFVRRRNTTNPPYDFLIPGDLDSPAEVPPDVEVGVPPTLQALRNKQFMERTSPLQKARAQLDTVIIDRERPTYRRLDIFWIDGRSGSGKSVLLLQLMAILAREGARVVWLRDRPAELLGLLRRIEANAQNREPEYIFVDDFYDPQGRTRLDLDEIVSLTTHRPEVNWPLVVTCGPPEFQQDLVDDAGAHGFKLHPWRIPSVDTTESQTLRQWFNRRTGRTAIPGPAFKQEQGLMVSMMFELRHGDLEPLAHRFRKRLEQVELKKPLYQLFAMNRLYVWSPVDWLTNTEQAQLEVINQDADFSFLSTNAGSGYLKLTHPHLSDIIYQVIRRPSGPTPFTDDLVAAFARALATDARIAVRLLRIFSSNHERLQILDQDRLAARCAQQWRDADVGTTIVDVNLLTDMKVQWAIWAATRPALVDMLGMNPLVSACTALAGGHHHWVRLWLALATSYANEPRVLEIGRRWVEDRGHFKLPYWSILWEKLLDADWVALRNGHEQRATLLTLGLGWLTDNEALPDWNYVWQRLLQMHDHLPSGMLGQLLAHGWNWGFRREDTPGWTHVWERLVEHLAELPQEVTTQRLMQRGYNWLAGREDAPEWPYVWKYLLNNQDILPPEINANALCQTGMKWLLGREDLPGWSRTWQFLLEHQDKFPAGIDSNALYQAGAKWLSGHENVLGWSYVWQFLLDHQDKLPAGIDSNSLLQNGANWLIGREDLPGWIHVWQCLLNHKDKLPAGIDASALYQTGAAWLVGREDSPEWAYNWNALWEKSQIAARDRERCGLLKIAIKWLFNPSHLAFSKWDRLFEAVLDAGETREELLEIGLIWIKAHIDLPQSPLLATKLLEAANPKAIWFDDLLGVMAKLLQFHAGGIIASRLLHSLMKSSVTNKFASPAVKSSGRDALVLMLTELSVAQRSFIEAHHIGHTLTGNIIAKVKNGYVVQLDDAGQVTAFLPGSKLGLKQPVDWSAAVGTSARMEIIHIDAASLFILVSCRSILERELLTPFKVGMSITGAIANITDQGLFVNMGEFNGFLHRSRLAIPIKGDLHLNYKVGQMIQARITKINKNNSHVFLAENVDRAQKLVQRDAKQPLLNSLSVGQWFDGTIKNIVDYGLFIDIGGMIGLLCREDFLDPKVTDLHQRFKKGQSIPVQIKYIDDRLIRVYLKERAPSLDSMFGL